MSAIASEGAAPWSVERVGALASSIQYGYTAKADSRAAGPKYLRITDIQNDTVDWASVPSCEIDQEDRVKFRLEPGDLVFARTGATVGKSFLIRSDVPDAVFASYLIRIRLKEGIDPRYVAYFFQSPSYWRQIGERQAGIGQPNVNGKKLAQIELPVAPAYEQRRIVSEIETQFSRLDEAVASLKRVKVNLSRQRLATFVSATSGRLLAQPGSSPDTSNVAERNTDLPGGWRWAELGELADVVRGGSPRPAGDPRYFGGPIPWITVGPITADEDDYLQSVPTGLTEAGRERSRYIEPHTLLLTNSGATLGVPKISLIGGCINDGVAALLNVDYPLKKYLLIYLHSKTEEMRRVNQGAAQPNLNTTIIKRYRVPVPPTDEQHRIFAEVDRRLSIFREVGAEVGLSMKRAHALRQSILARAFER